MGQVCVILWYTMVLYVIVHVSQKSTGLLSGLLLGTLFRLREPVLYGANLK
jgi:hypothetical protein